MTKEQFLDGVSNWDNHRILLWDALERTKDSKHPVMELGAGKGSTPFLRKYCEDNNRLFISYESDPNYAAEHNSVHIPNWEAAHESIFGRKYSVVLVDEAPGEHRKESIKLLHANQAADIIVIHDSEPPGWNGGDYQVRHLFDRFEFTHDLQAPQPGAWATWLSDKYMRRT